METPPSVDAWWCTSHGRPDALRWTITTKEENEEAALYLDSLERKLAKLVTKTKRQTFTNGLMGNVSELADRLEDVDYKSAYEDDNIDSSAVGCLLQEAGAISKSPSVWAEDIDSSDSEDEDNNIGDTSESEEDGEENSAVDDAM
eukprot:Ihof_evm11s45 gene=Ihof_evmTU11s45